MAAAVACRLAAKADRVAPLQALAGLLQKTGFAVQDIAVEGRQQTGKAEIFDAIGTESGNTESSLSDRKQRRRVSAQTALG